MRPKDYINKKAAEEALKAYQGTQLNNNQETSPYFVGKINADRTKITDPADGRQYNLIFTGNPKEFELAQRLSNDTAVVNAAPGKTINVDGNKKNLYFLYKFFNPQGSGTDEQIFLGFSVVRLKKANNDDDEGSTYDFEYFTVPTDWLPPVIHTYLSLQNIEGTVVYGKLSSSKTKLVLWSCEYFKAAGDAPEGNLMLHYSFIEGIKYLDTVLEATTVTKGSIDLNSLIPTVTLQTFTTGANPPPQPQPSSFSTDTCDISFEYTCEEEFSYSDSAIVRANINVADLVINGNTIDAIIGIENFEAYISTPEQLFSTQTLHVFGSSTQNGPYTYDTLTRYQYAFPTPILLEFTVNSTGVFPPGSTSAPVCGPQSTSYYSQLIGLYGDSGFNFPGVTTTNSGVSSQTVIIRDILGQQTVETFPIDYLDNSIPLEPFPNNAYGVDTFLGQIFFGAVSFGDYKTSVASSAHFNINAFSSIYNTPDFFTTQESYTFAKSTHILLLLSPKFNYFIADPTNDDVAYYFARSIFTVSPTEFVIFDPGLVNASSGGGSPELDPDATRIISINKVSGDGTLISTEIANFNVNFDSVNQFFISYREQFASAQNFRMGITSAFLV